MDLRKCEVLEYFIDDIGIYINKTSCFNLRKTLLCGQCFRFEEIKHNVFFGIVSENILTVFEEKDKIYFKSINEDKFKNFWINYFDLNNDYEKIKNKILNINKLLKEPVKYSEGIRILKQPAWEALCSYIFSQNNRIPRICAIIKRFCENFGKKIKDKVYSFPEPDIIAKLTKKDLEVIRCGFRDKYILDAAKKISSKEIILEDLKTKPIEEAKSILMKIYGVGTKVASCTLLYGLNRLDVFPIDTWIKKSMSLFFKNKNPEELGNLAGIAQQYIFYWIRNKRSFK